MKSLASEPGRLIGAGNEDVGTEIVLCLSCASRFFAHFFIPNNFASVNENLKAKGGIGELA